MLHGEPPYKCLDCDIFDKCHKITVAACLQAIATDLQLITQNGLTTSGLNFLIAFVTQRQEIQKVSKRLTSMAGGDITVWFCYPKSSSKRFKCDFNRDTGWDSLGAAGFEGVRQIAIDEDWSALRFRRVDYIKKMKRNPKRALTEKGKAKTRIIPLLLIHPSL